MSDRIIKVYPGRTYESNIIGFSLNCQDIYLDPNLALYFWSNHFDYKPYKLNAVVCADGVWRTEGGRDKIPPSNGFSNTYAEITAAFNDINLGSFAVFCTSKLFEKNDQEIFVYDNRNIEAIGHHVGKLIRRGW